MILCNYFVWFLWFLKNNILFKLSYHNGKNGLWLIIYLEEKIYIHVGKKRNRKENKKICFKNV